MLLSAPQSQACWDNLIVLGNTITSWTIADSDARVRANMAPANDSE